VEEEETVASPPLRFLDTQYGIRRDSEQLMIGDSPVFMNPDANLTIKGRVFRGTVGLWELLTRKNVNTQLVGKEELKTYNKILILTNAHLTRYQPGDNINIKRGKEFCEVIALLFAKPKGGVVESALRRKWKKYYCQLLARCTMTLPDRWHYRFSGSCSWRRREGSLLTSSKHG